MTKPTFPFLGSITALLRATLGPRLASGSGDYLDLFAEDAVIEIPYGPTETGNRIVGKPAIAAYMEQLRGVVTLEDMALTALHEAAGETVVLEYRGTVHAQTNNVRFGQRYVAVITLRDGQIVLFREYSNPLLARTAFKQVA